MNQENINEIYSLKDLVVGLSIPCREKAVSIENGQKINKVISLALDKLETILNS